MNIIAMGGGGFSTELDNPRLDRYILHQSEQLRPKICFLATASGDDEDYIQKFYDFFSKEACEPTHLSLLRPNVDDVEAFLLAQDIIYVGGGQTRNLLALWKEWDLDHILKKAWKEKIILAGMSAGAMCWFDEFTCHSGSGQLEKKNGLGLLPGSFCPHFNGDSKWRTSYTSMIHHQHLKQGYAADDGAAIHFVGTDIHVAVTSSPEAKAYRVTAAGTEEPLDMHLLSLQT